MGYLHLDEKAIKYIRSRIYMKRTQSRWKMIFSKPIRYQDLGQKIIDTELLSNISIFLKLPKFQLKSKSIQVKYTLKHANPDSTKNVLLLKNPQF